MSPTATAVAVATLLLELTSLGHALPAQMLTPPMGFSTWNYFAGDFNETVLREVVDALVQKGLRDLGYTFVNIDDLYVRRAVPTKRCVV
jgi:hypothetical protein